MSIKGVLLGVVLGVSVSSAFWYFTNPKHESVLEARIPAEDRMMPEKEIKAVEMLEKDEISLSGQEFETMVTRVPLKQTLDEYLQAKSRSNVKKQKKRSNHTLQVQRTKDRQVAKASTGLQNNESAIKQPGKEEENKPLPLDPVIQQHNVEKNKVDTSTQEAFVSEPQEVSPEHVTDIITDSRENSREKQRALTSSETQPEIAAENFVLSTTDAEDSEKQ